MRLATRFTALSLAALAAAAACQVASAAGPNAVAQEAEILAMQEAFKRALIARDTAALGRLWAEDYTFINASGDRVTRAERMANFASGATSVDVIDNERQVTVRVYGDAAVVQTLATLRARFGGRPSDGDLEATLVWVRRGGRWQLVTNQVTPVIP